MWTNAVADLYWLCSLRVLSLVQPQSFSKHRGAALASSCLSESMAAVSLVSKKSKKISSADASLPASSRSCSSHLRAFATKAGTTLKRSFFSFLLMWFSMLRTSARVASFTSSMLSSASCFCKSCKFFTCFATSFPTLLSSHRRSKQCHFPSPRPWGNLGESTKPNLDKAKSLTETRQLGQALSGWIEISAR